MLVLFPCPMSGHVFMWIFDSSKKKEHIAVKCHFHAVGDWFWWSEFSKVLTVSCNCKPSDRIDCNLHWIGFCGVLDNVSTRKLDYLSFNSWYETVIRGERACSKYNWRRHYLSQIVFIIRILLGLGVRCFQLRFMC